jgi:ABC-type glycerol-3-phosphate transport system substrate-binding protein
MIKRYVREGSGRTGPKMRIGRAVMALTILLFVSFFGSGVVRAQTITFAGDADQGEGGRWMRSKVEQFSKETGIEVHYIARPVSATETLMLWQQDWAAHTPDVDVYIVDVIWPGIAAAHAVDLKQYFTEKELGEFFPRIVLASNGAGTIVEPDGKVSINNPQTKSALAMAKGWVGTISPKGVTTYQEEEGRNAFQEGRAAFLRNWPYVYALANGKESAVKGHFDVTYLPQGDGPNATHAACLGGWQLMLSAYSKNKDAASKLIKLNTWSRTRRKKSMR